MHALEQLAMERTRDTVELAEQLRPVRRLRRLRRAQRREHKPGRSRLRLSRRS